jgi:hypothetical protein
VPGTLDPVTAADSDVKGPRRGVIYAIALSPLSDGRIWCGTDDGLIWLSRDDGKTWRDVTPKGLTAWSKVGIIEASHFDAETAYAAIDRHRVDDLTPIILRTKDGGTTWTSIVNGIPGGSFVNVVREDPVRRGLLYAGTETGMFVSFNDGGSWQPLQLNLPHCSIRDIDVRHGDLVVGTHGRSFWVIDDIGPLRQIDAIAATTELALLAPRPAVRLHADPFQGSPEPKDEPMADNPPNGAILDYFVKAATLEPVAIEILDVKGALVRRYASDDPKASPPDLQRIQITPDWVPVPASPSASAGMHRFVWDLRDALPPELVDPARAFRGNSGPWAPPGRYTVRLSRGGTSVTQALVINKDPRLPSSITDAGLVRQHELAREIQALRVRVAVGLRQAETLRKQIAAKAVPEEFAKTIDRAAGPPTGSPESSNSDPTTLARLAGSLSELQSVVESADAAPTADALTAFTERGKLVDAGLARWQAVLQAASELSP